MNLGFHEPPRALEPFVRRFITSDYDLPQGLEFQTWPTGHIYLIWFFGPLENYTVSINGKQQKLKEPLWFAGQTEYHDVRVAIRKRTSTVVAELAPQTYWRMFRKPGRTLTGATSPAGSVAHDQARNLLGGPSPVECGECLDRMIAFLEQAAAAAGPADPLLERALRMLESHHGRIGVGRVAAELRVSPRHLTRRFTEIVGLSPKFYSRVLQINQVVELMFLPGGDSIATVAQDAGYYDQAHLNRAMKLFFSQGPTAFLKSDHRLFRAFLEQLDDAEG
jgi:AraC-like DNA-binding protein